MPHEPTESICSSFDIICAQGREIPLRLSETKDKEALGDMETASTSTRENRY
jgi:hypothetical protein